jgi:hypothetical protein
MENSHKDLKYWKERIRLAEIVLEIWDANSSKLIEGNEMRGQMVEDAFENYRQQYPDPVS